jgi:hypothetical protein
MEDFGIVQPDPFRVPDLFGVHDRHR